MSEVKNLSAAVSLPTGFKINEVSTLLHAKGLGGPAVTPALGPLAAFTGNWVGSGFNTIFRPNSTATPTPLPFPVGGDNILELNLTAETMSFSAALGAVPNRGMVQGDIFLNGVPYLQAINDVTIAGQSTGIHLEPGLWVIAPATTNPAEGQTLTRMASIPHGTTINAQGTWIEISGAPVIPAVSITPNFNGGGPIVFPSQTAANSETARIPQDLTSYIAAGTITQAMLDDPNTVLRNHIAGQTITHTTQITVSTGPIAITPPAPQFGGGIDNIAFLQGNAAASAPNAQSAKMTATFWIETVQHVLHIPIFTPGHPPLVLTPKPSVAGQHVPTFHVTPPAAITTPRTIIVTSMQIQYSQTVNLNFNGLTWPHVSVATLVPATALPVPGSVW